MEETTAAEISSICESTLSSEEKSKDNNITNSSPMESKGKVDQDIEAKIKKDEDDKLNIHGKSEKNDEFMSRPSSQQSKAKEDEEILSNRNSQLNSEEKSPISKANLTEDQIKTRGSPSRVDLEEKVQHIETKPVEDKINLPSDGTSKETNESSSKEVGTSKETHESLSKEAKAKTALDQKLTTSDEKPLTTLACNRNEEDITSLELKTSTNSSRVELEEKTQHVGTEANPEHDLKTHHEASVFRAQRDPLEHSRKSKELLLNHATVTVREIMDPPGDSKGTHQKKKKKGEVRDEINQHEAICKQCFKDMCGDPTVLKAKCNCELSLIHEECKIKWSDEKGSTCPACGEQIEYIGVEVTLITDASTSSSQHNNTDQPKTRPSGSKKGCWSWF